MPDLCIAVAVCFWFKVVCEEREMIESVRQACMLNWTGTWCVYCLPSTYMLTLKISMIDVRAVLVR